MLMRARYVAALAVLVVLPWAGCYVPRVEESAVESARIEVEDRPVRVVVRVDDGSIEVTGSHERSVEVTFASRARARNAETARALLRGVRTRAVRDGDGVLVEAATGHESPRSGASLRTDVRLRTPPGSTLDLRTRDGSIELTSLEGEIYAESGDGRLRLRDVSGRLRLRTMDGSIRGEDLKGDVDALTEDGRIELEGAFTSLRAVTGDGRVRVDVARSLPDRSPWTLRTSDGSIRLVLPGGFRASLDASTPDGGIDLDVSGFSGERSERRARGTIGGGGPLVLATTADGRVSIEER